MQPKRFPIGFWNGENYWDVDLAERVDEWADLGFTLAMTPPVPDTPEAHEKARRLLDLAHAKDIQLILCDNRTRGPATNWSQFDAPATLRPDYRKQAAKAVKDFASHPATWSLFVLDEPLSGNFPAVAQACKIIRELTGEAEPYFNLMPYHAMGLHDAKWRIQNQVGFEDFNEYLDYVVRESQSKMLCYDCYSQMAPEWGGRDQYFRNLSVYQRAAVRHDIPFWTITLTLGHWMYRAPTEDDLAWEFNSALAYGAQGIMYFLYRAGGFGGWGAPIDELGQQGPLCNQMRRMHAFFKSAWEERYRRCKIRRTLHWPTAPPECQAFDGTGLVPAISANAGVSYTGVTQSAALIGEFIDDKNRDHVIIANNSPDPRKPICLTATFAAKAVYSINGPEKEALAASDESGRATIYNLYLGPGRAAFYRLEP